MSDDISNPTPEQIRRAEELGARLLREHQERAMQGRANLSEWVKLNGQSPSKMKNKPKAQCSECLKWRVAHSVQSDGVCIYCKRGQ